MISMRKKRADHTFQKNISNIATLNAGESVMGLVRNWAYMQKTCDVAVMAILAKKKLQKKCVNRDKSA